jgi:hypothetical protein
MNELQIRLTADIKDLQSAINKAKATLKSFESETAKDSEKSNVGFKRKLGLIEELNAKAKSLKVSLSQATNEQKISAFNAELEQTNIELARLNALGKSFSAPAVKSFDNLKRSAGAAAGTAISFSRIIQDAPFGIIGVANNIQNFGEQFVALGDKSTTAAGKLKLFFSALITPSNLAILAVSALTAAYQAYTLGLFDAEDKTKDVISETERFSESLNNVIKSLNDVDSARLKANKSAAEEVAEVQLLNSVLNNTSKSENERVIVYNKLLEKYPKIIGNITKEKALTEGLGEAYNLLISSIRERASLEAIADVFADVEKERIELIVKERKETLLQNALLERKSELTKNITSLSKSNNNVTARGTTTTTGFSEALSRNQAELASVNEQLSLLGNVSMKSTEKALQENSGTLTILEEQYGGLNQSLANLSTNDKPLKNLVRTFEDLSAFNVDMILERASLERLAKFSQEAEATFSSIRSGAADTRGVYTENIEAIRQKNLEFEESLQSIGLTSSQVFRAIASGAAEGYTSFSDFIRDLANAQETFNQAFQALEVGIENTIGDVGFAIGNALGSGTDALRAGGSALLGGIAGILNQLGQLAIGAGIAIESIKESLKGLVGAPAIIAGVALVSLAGFVSSQANRLSGRFGGGGGGSASAGTGSTFTNRREFGGPVSKGRAYIVGERRPELFVPNTNGVIVPQVPSMDYSGASVSSGMYGVEVMLKGPDDLLFFVEQAQIRRNIR